MSTALSRRGLLAAAGASVLLAGCGRTSTQKAAAAADLVAPLKIRYGNEHPDQFGWFASPSNPTALVVLIHGGYWLSQYTFALMAPAGLDLLRRGVAVWNIEYRRVGSGGGWPHTFADVAAALDFVTELPLPAQVRDALPVRVVGHSAGGHLAAWAASRDAHTPGGAPRRTADGTYSLSGVLDLTTAANDGIGNGAVIALMGGGPAGVPERYALGDPTLRVPAAGPVSVFHAEQDQLVPRTQATAYVEAATKAGGSATLQLVPGDHFTLVEPTSPAWKQIAADVVAGRPATV